MKIGSIAWIDNIYLNYIIRINKLKNQKRTMTKDNVVQTTIPHKFLNFQLKEIAQNYKKLLI